VRTSLTDRVDPDVVLRLRPENLVHRSIASVLAGALAVPLSVLGATAADAESGPRPKTVGVTLKTDAMPTRVEVTSVAGRVTCIKITAGSGRERRVWLTLDGRRTSKAYTRVAARQSSKCLLAGTAAPRGSTLDIKVEEDVLGPFNPRDTAALTL
jgi:hypothetical protein